MEVLPNSRVPAGSLRQSGLFGLYWCLFYDLFFYQQSQVPGVPHCLCGTLPQNLCKNISATFRQLLLVWGRLFLQPPAVATKQRTFCCFSAFLLISCKLELIKDQKQYTFSDIENPLSSHYKSKERTSWNIFWNGSHWFHITHFDSQLSPGACLTWFLRNGDCGIIGILWMCEWG